MSNVATFAIMGWAGLDAIAFLGGWAAHAAPLDGSAFAGQTAPDDLWGAMVGTGLGALLVNEPGAVTAVGYGSAARVYPYVGRSQRLCALQLCFQFKNFIDSCIHGDGLVFLLHHTATGKKGGKERRRRFA